MEKRNNGKKGNKNKHKSHSNTETNRKYKDSIFQLLFEEKESIAELYAALENKETPRLDEISIVTLKSALFNKMMNDLAFSIGDEYIILAEAQSTKAENMPMRMLLYLAREYERVLDLSKLHERKLRKVPTPHFYVLYNGIQPMAEVTELKLSDAYAVTEKEPMLDMVVKVININVGNNRELLSRSRQLNGYSILIDKVRQNLNEGNNRDEAIEIAIKECVKENVLKKFLEEHGAEVANKMFTEFTYEDMLKIRVREEVEEALEKVAEEAQAQGLERGLSQGLSQGLERGLEQGLSQGLEQGLEQGLSQGLSQGLEQKALEDAANLKRAGVDIKVIAECIGLSIEEVESLV